MDGLNQKCIYVVVCGRHAESKHEAVYVIAAYDELKIAEDECQKRNQYENSNYGDRSDWYYSIQKHKLNEVFWKL